MTSACSCLSSTLRAVSSRARGTRRSLGRADARVVDVARRLRYNFFALPVVSSREPLWILPKRRDAASADSLRRSAKDLSRRCSTRRPTFDTPIRHRNLAVRRRRGRDVMAVWSIWSVPASSWGLIRRR
jgi:hypothetical protein